MERKLSIILIEDDDEASREIDEYVQGLDDINLVGTTKYASKGLELVQTFMPDVILLDLELHQGGGNGLLFLSELGKLQLGYKPYILITTNNVSEITFDSARKLGADLILTKYEKGYSAQYVVESVRMMKESILMKTTMQTNVKQKLTPGQKEQKIRDRIRRELDLIGVSPKLTGFRYLLDAICIVIQKQEPYVARIIAEKYNKTDASVERAMQNAINRTWYTSDTEDLLKYYTARIRSDKGVPTLMEFISYYANKIRTELQAE